MWRPWTVLIAVTRVGTAHGAEPQRIGDRLNRSERHAWRAPVPGQEPPQGPTDR
jgi:hypothetical protein